MTRFAVLCALFAAAPLFGQTADVAGVREVMNEERNEDIEVLRRLLNKSFGFDHVTSQLPEPAHGYYGSTGSTFLPTTGGGFTGGFGQQPAAIAFPVGKRVSQAVGPFDGVYLKGSGVVFTLRLPKEEVIDSNSPVCVGGIDKELGLGTTCNGCHNEAKAAHKGVDAAVVNDCAKCHTGDTSASLVKPLSDWDRTKADVRGEKVPEVKSTADPKKPRAVMCKPGDLRELLISQLHSHAKHLRHLEPNDWVTVVVTFDEPPGAKAHPTPLPSGKPGFTADERQALTLGDLHLKQGKPAEAVAAYEKGLTRYRDAVIRLTFPPTVPAAEVPKAIAETQTNVRGLFKSLATAYLQTNDLEKARAALDKATSLRVELAATGAEKAKPRLPAKIVLSVCKSDIDRGVKLDEFRKAVSVETPGFPPPEKK